MIVDLILLPVRILAVLFGVLAALIYSPIVILLGADEVAISALGEPS